MLLNVTRIMLTYQFYMDGDREMRRVHFQLRTAKDVAKYFSEAIVLAIPALFGHMKSYHYAKGETT
jgi:hypothetical protein